MLCGGNEPKETVEDEMCEEVQRWTKLAQIYDVNTAFNETHLHDDIEGVEPLANTWIKERIRNYNVALVLALNCDVDPPDVTKPSPCARLQAWFDPTGKNPQHAVNQIGNNLHKQYEAWQSRARYKLCLDPTVEEVKKLCQSMRRGAKEERVVFHYNGHGVPRPTENGEIWVFNKNYTQYIPLSIYDLQSWMGAPSVYVFDCHNAERIIKNYYTFCEKRRTEASNQPTEGTANETADGADSNTSCSGKEDGKRSNTTLCMDNTIIFAACREKEQLPLNPEMPADLFTSCLTTPIKVALRFYFMEYRDILPGIVTEELLMRVPGIMTDRRTMLGEIYWLFAAVTDSIAWNSVSIDLFQRLFRQDLITASLARNFLLAQRVMYYFECNPVCWPNLPSMQTHRLWQSWDVALEQYLRQLPSFITNNHLQAGLTASNILNPSIPPIVVTSGFEHTKFFEEQLTAFELWLNTSSERKGLAAQLPVLLQVLLSQNHRIRALDLLGRFVDQGVWAMNQALQLGIFPYLVRLLQSRTTEVRPSLTFLWSKIIAFCDLQDNHIRQEIMKDKGFNYFLEVIQDQSLMCDVKTRAVYVLANIMDGQQQVQITLLNNNIVNTLLEQLDMCEPHHADKRIYKLWIILCLSKLWCRNDTARWFGVRYNAHEKLYLYLRDVSPLVRAATVLSLGTYVDNSEEERSDHANTIDHNVGITLTQTCLSDASPLVRRELVAAFSGLVKQFESQFVAIGCQYIEEMSQAQENAAPAPPHTPTRAQTRHGSVDFGRGLLNSLLTSMAAVGASNSNLSGVGSPPSLAPPAHHPRMARERHSLQPNSSGTLLSEAQLDELSSKASMIEGLQNGGVVGGLRKVASSNMFFAGSTLGGNVYAQLWKALMALTNDPSDEVNKMARLIIVNIRNKMYGKSAALSEQRASALIELNQRSISSLTTTRSSTSISTPSRRGAVVDGNRSSPGTPSQSPSRRQIRGRFIIHSAIDSRGNSPPKRPQLPGTPQTPTISSSTSATLIHSAQFPTRKHFAEAQNLAAPSNPSTGSLAAELAKVETELFRWCSSRFREPLYSCPPERDPLSPPFQARLLHLQDQREQCTKWSREWNDTTPLSEQIFVQKTSFCCHLLRFHPYHDHLAAAERKSVYIWNWESCQLRRTLVLKPPSESRCITALHFVNPNEERGLLMTGCEDGSVRIYRNYFPDMGQDPEVITAWMALSDMLSSNRRAGLVSAWSQRLGQLAVSGDVKYVRLWDTEHEAIVCDIPTSAQSCVTCMERSEDGRSIAVGLGDGCIRLLDANRCDASPLITSVDSGWIHALKMDSDANQLWTLSSEGLVRTFDTRFLRQAVQIQLESASPATQNSLSSQNMSSVLTGSQTCWDMHLGAKLVAVGRLGPVVTLHSLRTGRSVNSIKYYEGLLGQRIGTPISIAFHPTKMVFGVSTKDEYITVFSPQKRI